MSEAGAPDGPREVGVTELAGGPGRVRLDHATVAFPPEQPVALTIGVFDGVHRGHQALIRALIADAHARAPRHLAAALTFDPPPKAVLRPDPHFRQLGTLADRVRRLAALGLDGVLTLEFTPAVAAIPAGEFLTLLGGALNVRHIVVGANFALGRGREGTPEALAELGRSLDITVHAVDLLPLDSSTGSAASASVSDTASVGVSVSSTRTREALADGDVELAAALLGRPFSLTGRIGPGDQRGRTIGFPTANIPLDPALMWPKLGVYAVRVMLDGDPPGSGRPGVANLGVRPTFNLTTPLLEVHLLDFSGDIYGRAATVDFIARLRDEQRFPGLDALVAQIQRDANAARARLLPG